MALLLAPAFARADTATLRQADTLIKSGQPAQAVQILQPLGEAEASNAAYHYLLGIAYLDSGKLNDAISELKRSLALKPDLLQAKAELGRAYVLKGDTLNAYLTFKEVRAAHPPPEAVAGMESYIDQAARQMMPQNKLSGAVTLSYGVDTNVNSGTAATSVALPIFGGVSAQIDPSQNPRRDEFGAIGGFVNAWQDLTENLNLVGSATVNARFDQDRDLSAYDTRYANVSAGPQYTVGDNQFTALGIYEIYDYLGSRLYTQSGAQLEWRRLTGGPFEVEANYRYTYLDYNDLNSFRNAQRQVVGLALLPSFFGRRLQYAPSIFNFYAGTEHPVNEGSKNLGYSLVGIRGAYYQQVCSAGSVALSAGFEERRYDAADPVFFDTRQDRQYDASAAFIYDVTHSLSVIPSVQWIRSNSNIEVYAFHRALFTLSLRQSF